MPIGTVRKSRRQSCPRLFSYTLFLSYKTFSVPASLSIVAALAGVIDLDVDDEVLIGTISAYDDELTIRSYYYTEYPEDIYWETQNGSVILRKSYNHYGRNLIEDDDGYIFEKTN